MSINNRMKHKHHIIPRHAGGTDDPKNLIELTPEEHAEAHRLLWEEYGRWQDYCAWKGLEGYSSREEHIKLVLSESAKASNKARTGIKYNVVNKDHNGDKNPCARTYKIIHPGGKVETVKSLKTWCEAHGLKYNSFHAQMKRGKSHKGYFARKV